MTRVYWLSQAETNMAEAIEFYEAASIGLGISFANEVEALLQRLQANPESGSLIVGKIRKSVLTKFPYISFIKRTARIFSLPPFCIKSAIRKF
jgi:plasmid stabilization system protein ParE